MQSYKLSREQQRAFEQLKSAFADCDRLNIYLWNNDGMICAVNGNVVKRITPDETYGTEKLDDNNVFWFGAGCWHSSNADDPLYVVRKEKK